MVEFPLSIAMSGGPLVDLVLRGSGTAERGADGALSFTASGDRPRYLSSTGHSRFRQVPEQSALPLVPRCGYVLRGEAVVRGGQAELWVIQYDATARLDDAKITLRDGVFVLRFTTAERYARCVLALRLTGAGQIALRDVTLAAEGPVAERPAEIRTGPAARFGAYSIFFDPAGYKSYVEKHHRHYAERGPQWYAGVAQELAGCERVLELGCGPGLLLMALRNAGVRDVVGLERDPVYLEQCRQRGLTVHAHDLNLPFPFVASDACDAVVAHYAFEYLAPTAQRTVLREARRVLRPGGRLLIVARHDGQGSGDEARAATPLTAARLHEWLSAVGFHERDISLRGNRLRCEARGPDRERAWPTRVVTLRNGQVVRPWKPPQAPLEPQAEAWDNLAARDFTPLTDVRKEMLRVGELHIAYHTGYHDGGGEVRRAIMRSASRDGQRWRRDPLTPVLTAGEPSAWDEGGVAAGSVIPSPAPRRGRYALYYTGRDAAGAWPGIGLAFSDDGVTWERQPARVLRVEDFDGLRYLALADVIRLDTGRWLMHCEGWLAERSGWAIVQAESDDGLTWRPTSTAPVLHPATVPWAGHHVANPKVVPLDGQNLLMGFNGADVDRRFQLGLAESADGRAWQELPVNPVICTRTGLRAESCFLPRDAWRRGEQLVYYFEATGQDTYRTSRVLCARADDQGEWVGPPWETQRPGLYRVRAERLIADPGAREKTHALCQTVRLERETQVMLRMAGGVGRGGVRLILSSARGESVFHVRRDGSVGLDAQELADADPAATTVSAVLRVVNPTRAPEFTLDLWHAERLVRSLHQPLPWPPRELRVELAAPLDKAERCPADETPLEVEVCDIWQPAPCAVDGLGDAHTGMGMVRSDDPLLPDIAGERFLECLTDAGVGRALVVSYGSGGQLDTFDQAAALREQWPGRIFPLLRVPAWATGEADERFQVDQLELLWQQGLLGGLKINLGRPERPTPAVLEWVAARQVLTHWHAGSDADLNWLEENVLRRYAFPVLLAHFGGYPLCRRRYERCIDWLARYRETYLVTSVVFYAHYLAEAIRRHPTRVLLGSDFPGIDIGAARTLIERLDVPADAKALVLAENLRFLTERMAWHRWELLRVGDTLRFPVLPQTAADVAAQGFEVVPPDKLPADEDDLAKAYWSEHVSEFYLKPKPWSRYVAQQAVDLGVGSVFEFGCHAGRNLEAIRQRLPTAALTGIDINAAAVAAGRERFNLDLRVGNEATLAEYPDGDFDMVLTISVLDHVPRIEHLCRELLRLARRVALFLEVTLPVEGKVLRHYDHQERGVRASTAASYSWRVDRFLRGHPRVWRLDCRPTYVQPASLGPYYVSYLAWLDPP